MDVLLQRLYKKPTYTIGSLFIDGVWFCNTLEDADRGLLQSMSIEEIKKIKIFGETAIPAGRYIIRMDIVSERYKFINWYFNNCGGGRMPRLEVVKAFVGILFHPGNKAEDSLGCILVGLNKKKGALTDSKKTFLKLWNIFEAAYQRKETIYLTIE